MQHSMSESTAVEKYFLTRQLPSLQTIASSSEDDRIRTKLSTMSVRESNPLLKRVMDPSEQCFQRRHSIANTSETYGTNKPAYSPYSAPSTPPYNQNQSSSYYFHQEEGIRRNSLATSRRDSSHRIASLILNEDENNGQRRASTSSISSSSSSLQISQEETARGRYTRSPELRASHKIAERKRRQEMKDLFDELKKNLPLEKSLKTSKWEILSKSIDYIEALHHRIHTGESELLQLKKELGQLKQNAHML
ncbi:hypothetical protein BY458DRAFT_495650 [Sporodiniella umbellata]|nr:hypothetical protein BY458DRAFT_495650 [Sporodiniella umbellata]